MAKRKEKEARLMQQQLKDNADERNTYIKMAFAALSDADKASNKAVLEKTRDIINDTFRGEASANLATIIANGVQLQHINENKDSMQTTRANPPSQSSASSSSSSSGARRLGKEAVMDTA